ncbi:hypothetical protein [Cryobacterium sp. AP23]
MIDKDCRAGADGASEPHNTYNARGAPRKTSDGTESSASPQLIRSLQATEDAWQRIEAEFGLLTAEDVAGILGATTTNWSTLFVLRNTGKVIAVNRGSSIRYPAFQFDHAQRVIFPVIEPLIEVACANQWSCEDLTLWMIGPTTSFDNEDRPVDHVREPELLLAAAHSHMEALG